MNLSPRDRQGDSLISTIGSVSGVVSLILAVAGNNLDRLTPTQRWGLAVASAVMLWSFLAGIVFQQFSTHRDGWRQGKAIATLFVGGLVGGGLLVAAVPFFSFGLPASHIDG